MSDVRMTLDVPVTVEVELTAEDGSDAAPVLEEMVLAWESLRASRAVVDCPYAVYQEFGTGPVQRKGGGETTLWDALDRWVTEKLGLTGEEHDRALKRIYWQICKRGLLPHPFFRPAIADTMSEVREDWLDAGHTLADIAQGIAERAKRNIEHNNQDYTRRMRQSIASEIVETSIPLDPDAPADSEIDEYVWDSTELGFDGKSRPDPRNWSRP